MVMRRDKQHFLTVPSFPELHNKYSFERSCHWGKLSKGTGDLFVLCLTTSWESIIISTTILIKKKQRIRFDS